MTDAALDLYPTAAECREEPSLQCKSAESLIQRASIIVSDARSRSGVASNVRRPQRVQRHARNVCAKQERMDKTMTSWLHHGCRSELGWMRITWLHITTSNWIWLFSAPLP